MDRFQKAGRLWGGRGGRLNRTHASFLNSLAALEKKERGETERIRGGRERKESIGGGGGEGGGGGGGGGLGVSSMQA